MQHLLTAAAAAAAATGRRCTLALLVVTLIVVTTPSLVSAQSRSESRSAALYRESYALEASRDYVAAIARVREASKAGSDSYFANVRLGWLTYLAGDFAESVARYTDAISAAPTAIEPKLGLTLPLLAAGKWRELERACREALAVDTQNVTALGRLAMSYYSLGNFGDAATTYRRLADSYPATLDYKTGLGWALLKLGRSADARAQFEAVLAVSPDNTSAKQGMAVR